MKVGIILVNYKDYAQRFLTPCLASIRALDASCRPDIFIVDNASTAESAAYLRDQAPAARFIFNKNKKFNIIGFISNTIYYCIVGYFYSFPSFVAIHRVIPPNYRG